MTTPIINGAGTIIKGASEAPVSTAQVTGYGTTTSIQPREVGSKLYYLDSSAAPFTLLADRSSSQVTTEPRFEWWI